MALPMAHQPLSMYLYPTPLQPVVPIVYQHYLLVIPIVVKPPQTLEKLMVMAESQLILPLLLVIAIYQIYQLIQPMIQPIIIPTFRVVVMF